MHAKIPKACPSVWVPLQQPKYSTTDVCVCVYVYSPATVNAYRCMDYPEPAGIHWSLPACLSVCVCMCDVFQLCPPGWAVQLPSNFSQTASIKLPFGCMRQNPNINQPVYEVTGTIRVLNSASAWVRNIFRPLGSALSETPVIEHRCPAKLRVSDSPVDSARLQSKIATVGTFSVITVCFHTALFQFKSIKLCSSPRDN